MIHILFAPGAFGSMIEWSIRAHAVEYSPVDLEFNSIGSAHQYKKMFHPSNFQQLTKLKELPADTITSIGYPLQGNSSLALINFFKEAQFVQDRIIFTLIRDRPTAELILLMLIYKLNLKNYVSANNLELWEYREQISLFYNGTIQQWLNLDDPKLDNWLVVNPIDIIYNYDQVVDQCLKFCNLTKRNDIQINEAAKQWLLLQNQYISKHTLISDIVNNTILNQSFDWTSLDVLSEAIVQMRLRDRGYHLKCYKLNSFPTNSQDLYKLI